jgi:chromate transporter
MEIGSSASPVEGSGRQSDQLMPADEATTAVAEDEPALDRLEAAPVESERPRMSLARLLPVFLLIGATSFGRGSMALLSQELMKRRNWLTPEEFAEGYALSQILPGPTPVNLAVYAARRMNGPLAAVICVFPLLLPGILANLALAMFVLRTGAPPWMRGVLAGGSAGAVGLILSTMLQMLPAARRARFWPVSLVAAFVLTMIGVPLLVILLGGGAVSLLFNWSGQRSRP